MLFTTSWEVIESQMIGRILVFRFRMWRRLFFFSDIYFSFVCCFFIQTSCKYFHINFRDQIHLGSRYLFGPKTSFIGTFWSDENPVLVINYKLFLMNEWSLSCLWKLKKRKRTLTSTLNAVKVTAKTKNSSPRKSFEIS